VLSFDSKYVALIAVLTFVGVLATHKKSLTYYATKIFFNSIFSIFFSSIEVLGLQNIPAHGPVIFTGNHMNQFVDGAVMLVTNPHQVGFLIAEKSHNHPVIGSFSKAVGSIPVARPQDKAVKGAGRIKFDKLKIVGDGTYFTKLKKGDKIRPGRSPSTYRVQEVISDTEGILSEDTGETSPLTESCQDTWVTYEVLEYVDQSNVFSAAHEALRDGRCIGIFPEGGSHDNTDLLPLKPGITTIAFGTLDKFDLNVPIVPVGLTYFRGHRFRGRAVVEFGQPIHIDKNLHQVYKTSRRQGYIQLLQKIEDGMRSVIVTAESFNELQLIHTVRRLYQRASSGITTDQKQDISRRFSAAYRILKEKWGDNFPTELAELKKKIEDYQKTLDHWGLKDYQVGHLDTRYSTLLYKFLHGFFVGLIAFIPTIFLNLPVGLLAKLWSHKEAKKDLKNSRVKIAARDVLLSKKIVFSIVAVPTLWISYAILMYFFSGLKTKTIVLLFLSCPVFSYIGVRAAEMGMIDIKDLRPSFLQLLPGFKHHTQALPIIRANLQREVRLMVKKYGPELGAIYYEKTKDWEKMKLPKSKDSEGSLAKILEDDVEIRVRSADSSASLATSSSWNMFPSAQGTTTKKIT